MTKILISFFILAFTSKIEAQIPFLQLSQTAGGSEQDAYFGVCSNNDDGGWIATGYTKSIATPPLIPTDSEDGDCIVTRYTASGAIVWSRVYNQPEVQSGYEIIKTSDGGYLIAGIYTTSEPFDLDYFLMKIDEAGNEIWSNHYGGTNIESFHFKKSIFENNGNYSFATVTASQDGDVLGGDGHVLWYVTVNSGGDIVSQLTYDLDGDLSAVGTFLPLTDGGFAFLAKSTIYKFDSSLQLIWETVDIAPTTYEMIHLNEGGFMVLSATDYNDSNQTIKWHVTKFDELGQLVWRKQIPSVNGFPNYMSFAQTSSGIYGRAIINNDGHILSVILELNSNGELLWTANDGYFIGDSYYWDIAQLSNGEIVVAGSIFADDLVGTWPDFKILKFGSAFVNSISLYNELNGINICGGSLYTIDISTSFPETEAPLVQIQLSDLTESFENPIILGEGSQSPIQIQFPAVLSPGYYLVRAYIPSNGSASHDPLMPGITIAATQVFLFAESMGSVASTTAVSVHEAANGFDNDSQTMTGDANVGNGSSSAGEYAGASGGSNINMVDTDTFFEIEGINTSGVQDAHLSFGHYKSNNLGISAGMTVKYSTDGIHYTSLSYSVPVFSSGWSLVNIGNDLPQAANLRLQFKRTSLASGTIRIDDIKISGMMGLTAIQASGPVNWCGASSVVLTSPNAEAYEWNTGAITQSITVNSSGSYFCTVQTSSGCVVELDPIVVTTTSQLWYADNDNDGYGGASSMLCASNSTYDLTTGGDCNDNNPSINPDGIEICNNLDDNCNGLIDEDMDQDTDGYSACDGDCDDDNAAIHPGANDVINGVDDNCDGITDQPSESVWYLDNDGDGYGTPLHVSNNETAPIGYVANALDCDDDDATRYPTADDSCGDNIDNNCDGLVDNCVCVGDLDGNGAVNVGDLLIFTSVFGTTCN